MLCGRRRHIIFIVVKGHADRAQAKQAVRIHETGNTSGHKPGHATARTSTKASIGAGFRAIFDSDPSTRCCTGCLRCLAQGADAARTAAHAAKAAADQAIAAARQKLHPSGGDGDE
jgi:hypothetical protein